MAYIISSGKLSSGSISENDSMTATNGGIQIIPDFNVAGIQLIYLDFDGELTKYRNVDMDLEIDDVQVEDSRLTPERIAGIVASLNAEFSGQNVLFVTERPKDTAYSTIFIGKTSAFDQYGQFAGLAETVDLGNRIKNDNAFILLDASDSDNSIISTIAHEAGHLLGTLDHGGDGIARMATYKVYSVFSGDIVSGTVLYFDSMYVYDGGTANDIFVSHGGRVHVWDDSFVNNPWLIGGGPLYECALYVSSGGLVTGATVNTWGFIDVYSGGTANYTTLNWNGGLDVSSGGVANYTTVYGGGNDLCLYSGGVVNHTVLSGAYVSGNTIPQLLLYGGLANGIEVNESALVRIYSGGTATDTTINSGGSMYVSSGGTATEITENGGYVNVAAGANVTFVSNTFSGLVLNNAAATVHSGTTANNTTINVKSMYYSGNFGYLYVSSGGIANSTTVNNWGCLYVSSGGTATDTTINSGGGMYVSSGGTANSTTVDYRGYLSVSSGGTANSTTISGGSMVVSSGGTANSTTVNSGGGMYVFSGGTANNTTVNSYGSMHVSSGGIANRTTINEGSMYVSSGGTAFDIVWTPCEGHVYVLDGGYATFVSEYSGVYYGSDHKLFSNAVTMDGKVVGSSYEMNVMNGGTVNSTIVSEDGSLYVSSGGTANNTTVYRGGGMRVFSGGTANNTTVNNRLYVFSGGTANSTTVNGYLHVYSGGTANSTTVNRGGYMGVSSGGMLTGRTVCLDGVISAYIGAIMNFDLTKVLPGAAARINNLASITGSPFYTITVNADQAEGTYTLAEKADSFNKTITVASIAGEELGALTVGETVTISDTAYTLNLTDSVLSLKIGEGETPLPYTSDGLVVSSSAADVKSGEVFHDTLVYYGKLNVSSGGTANSTTVNTEGYLYVSSGGTANSTTVNNWGDLYVFSGGTATDTSVNVSGMFFVSSGGTANNTTVNEWGSMRVFSGGIANNTTVNMYGGGLCVSSGGTATETLINGGRMYVSSGGTANNTTVNEWGSMYVSSGGTATEIKENGGCVNIADSANVTFVSNTFSGLVLSGNSVAATVHSGTTANSTTVNHGGYLLVSSGGTANSTTVNSGGGMYVYFGGTANSTTVNSRGYLCVSSGGTATGKMTFADGAIVSAFRGAILDFDISQVAPGDEARLNDLSIIRGTPTYTLTVDGSQAEGAYKLATGAAGFNKTITVVNTEGTSLGTLKVGETAKVNGADYTLNLNDGTLSVEVVSSVVPGWMFFEGDFNGDGKDMLAAQKDSTVTIYQNGEAWGAGLVLDPGWDVVGTGDFNGDKLDDFLRVNTDGYVVGEMSNGNGTFTPQVLNFLNAGWEILGTGDFNGNGSDDVLIANPTGASETVGLLGYWESGVTWTLINGYSPEWECVSTGDFNGDGKCDMLWRNSFEGEGGLTYNAYCTWIVENAVDWRMVSVANPDEWNFLCSGDFDGNGSHDIAMINGEGVVGIWGVNDGYLNSWSILSAVDTSSWTLAGVGDFNADGTDDIAWASDSLNLAGYWQINDKQLTTWANIATLS